VEAARIDRIRDGRMTVTGGADGSRATSTADGLRTTGVDEGPQQRPRRADEQRAGKQRIHEGRRQNERPAAGDRQTTGGGEEKWDLGRER